MSILNWLGIGETIAKPIEAAKKFYTSDKERLDAEVEFEKTQETRGLAQLQNNRVQLLSKYIFESAWQPLSGWTAGLGIFLYYIPQLTLANYIWITNCLHIHKIVPFPIDPTNIMQLVYLMFGFGTYHVVHKKING
jgi:hypothetical protein